MLRIIYLQTEVQAELQRISDRASDTAALQSQENIVQEIVTTVKHQGDRALVDYTKEFDHQTITPEKFRVRGSELDAAYQQLSKDLIHAIQLACQQITAFHRQKIPKSWVQFAEDEIVLGQRYTPIDQVGLYIRGGRAAYLSTVLMSIIPAKVAKVPRIVMVTPPGENLKINPAVLVAAQEAGVDEIYRLGGAQGIAALAYGTATIPPVDFIAGSGNTYVNLAKKIVFGKVGIDSLTSGSEIVIIADENANPVYIAADLIATAAQDYLAAPILLTNDTEMAHQVQQEVLHQLSNHPLKTLTEKSISHYGLIGVVESLEIAATLSNFFAPKHLALHLSEPWDLIEQIRHAGTIFMGESTPEAVGHYLAGPNHILPTSGTARFASALGVETFLKQSSVIEYSSTALKKMSSTLQILARAEGRLSHTDSIRFRTEEQ
ncbi:histidinol dehydrogenase [Xenococcus sp. PCC 7305]|uniref:histidinol dehydrogenase n=1 Tax=Xenococcus sp. PCC 7305 TaxID=102125 RepID=UPI0002AD06F9|nr:histidinol dehydrogenase [Xenococcus sp. PCC 7305]ELS01323.1 histidinol dehydrogenase [Xenococcus sp. PCC 7305]